jgi:hypothetical protein
LLKFVEFIELIGLIGLRVGDAGKLESWEARRLGSN